VNTNEVAVLFRAYTDESDATFLSDADVATFLNIAYKQFRQLVQRQDNFYFATRVQITLSNKRVYDLSSTGAEAVTVLGPSPSAEKMTRLLRVGTDDSSGNLTSGVYLRACRSTVEVTNSIFSYMLEGSKLYFSGDSNQKYNLEYVPEAPTVFTTANIQTGAGAVIDNLSDYHDLIALLAYRQYAIKDFQQNPVVEIQLAERRAEITEYLQEGRAFNARSSVISVDEADFFNP
tara:strand:- start:3754 stop:4452 length:699 start_codon:yes stop_codon:yes gene_type:complete